MYVCMYVEAAGSGSEAWGGESHFSMGLLCWARRLTSSEVWATKGVGLFSGLVVILWQVAEGWEVNVKGR